MFSSNTSAVSGDAVFVEEVFSTYLYTGNATARSISNGIDLASKGGMVWIKNRSTAHDHILTDTARGVNNYISSNLTAAQVNDSNFVSSANSDGFSIGTQIRVNATADNFASWTFRKQPKFFDVVTYTGTGAVQNIAHSLGSIPGCIIVKGLTSTPTNPNWAVYHRSLGNDKQIQLNLTNAAGGSSNTSWNNTDPTSTVFTVGTNNTTNASGQTYVAYLFAHDAGGFGLTGTDNVISCGTFTTDGSGAATVSLGYEPQWVLQKRTDSATGGNWYLLDNMRGFTVGDDNGLYANTSAAEAGIGNYLSPTATGISVSEHPASATYIYIAIRRGPTKVPTDGTKVFAPVTRTGDGVVTTNFPVDLSISTANQTTAGKYWDSRLTMGLLQSDSTAAESASTVLKFDSNTSTTSTGFWGTTLATLWYSMRRAPSFFDEVCYTGTGVTNRTVTHNLAAAPQLLFVKARSNAQNWSVLCTLNSGLQGRLNATDALSAPSAAVFGNGTSYVAPTSSVFTVGTDNETNASGWTYVAYLFATCAGVSKVFSYTGNGSSQTINCGFTGGARWIMIKRTDSSGDWYVWDTARGIVSGNDPHLSLNTTSAEVTSDDTIDTDSTGFIVNQLSATNVNVSSATYIGIAIA